MPYELNRLDFSRILPFVEPCPFDPTMYAVIEGRKNGRIFTNHPTQPTSAFIWTYTDWAYMLGGVDDTFYQWLHTFIMADCLPFLADIGYLSIFTYSSAVRSKLRELFKPQFAHSPAVNTFDFDAQRFAQLRARLQPLPNGYSLNRITPAILSHPKNQHLQADFAFYWDNINSFWQWGLGMCILHDDAVVSCFSSDAFGGGGHRVNVWTTRDHRGRGLARQVGTAFVSHCLSHNLTPMYLCDDGNAASHRLAACLGFVYVGNLFTVDVPLRPFHFYTMLGNHFKNTLQLEEQAARFFEIAANVQETTNGK